MKKRDSNFELLRIAAMLLIVAFHTFRYIDTTGFNATQMLAYHAVRWYGLLGVNCFVMISAWFTVGRQTSPAKLKPLLTQTLFYLVLLFGCHTIYQLARGQFSWSQDVWQLELDGLFAPLWSDRYWFITAYIGMYLLIPVMNRWIASLDRIRFDRVILWGSVILFVFVSFPQTTRNTSILADVLWLCYVYMVTAWLKLHHSGNVYERHAAPLFLGGWALFLASRLVMNMASHTLHPYLHLERHLSWLLSHTFGSNLRYSFMMLYLAIGLFYLFGRLHFQSRIVNTIAGCTFGVYLLHENPVFHLCELLATGALLPAWPRIMPLPLFMVTLVLGQFTLGVLLELVRKHISACIAAHHRR